MEWKASINHFKLDNQQDNAVELFSLHIIYCIPLAITNDSLKTVNKSINVTINDGTGITCLICKSIITDILFSFRADSLTNNIVYEMKLL